MFPESVSSGDLLLASAVLRANPMSFIAFEAVDTVDFVTAFIAPCKGSKAFSTFSILIGPLIHHRSITNLTTPY